MTNKQRELIERLRRYFESKDENDYKSVMSMAQKDVKFETMVQNMTTDRIIGGNSLSKNNIKFK